MVTETWDDAADTGLSKDTLADGVYEMRIVKWSGKPFEKGEQRGRIVKLKFEIDRTPEGSEKLVGQEFDYDEWLTRPTAKRIFFDCLKAVGFDVASWVETSAEGEFTKGRMLPLALKYLKLRGVPVLVKKWKSNDGFSNLRLVGRPGDAVATIANADVAAVADEPETAEEVF